MINKVVLVGRLTRNPNELIRTTSNVSICSFTLAVDNRFDKEKGADFFTIVTFNKTAEFVDLYAKKGSLVGVEGRLQSRSYEDKEGKRVYVVEVIADSVQLLESKKDTEQRQVQQQPKVEPKNDNPFDMQEDDLPF